jgi:predicted Zn-dependent peptidase
VGGYLGFMGEPFGVRDPTALVVQAHLPPGGAVAPVLGTIDEELDRLATGGLADGELARTQARMATHLLRDTDAVLGRGLTMAVLELQRGDPGLLNELPRMVGSVTAEELVAAAATLRAERRASVEVVPGGSAA